MRVYLPLAVSTLADWHSSGTLPPPNSGFVAVTDNTPTPGLAGAERVDAESAEYAAFDAAVRVQTGGAPRLVASVDCEPAAVVEVDPAAGAVRVDQALGWAAVASVHCDDPDSAEPDPFGHLLWFGPGEVQDLLARIGPDSTSG